MVWLMKLFIFDWLTILQGMEAPYGMIFKTFFLVWFVQLLKKNVINLNLQD